MPTQIEKGLRGATQLQTTARRLRLTIATTLPHSEFGIPKIRHFDYPQRQHLPHRFLHPQNND